MATRRSAHGGPALAVVSTGCLELSPHALPTDESESDPHRKALERLQSQPMLEVLRFAALGDRQGSSTTPRTRLTASTGAATYRSSCRWGDFVHFGLLPEHQAMNDVFLDARAPGPPHTGG